jgi:2-polyprenyl-3-methyl-5-hydroxy-6-metoxy-1,4-benzoquinol methylase
MSSGLHDWHYQCGSCQYEKADLKPTINSSQAHDRINEAAREDGLRELRVRNFKALLGAIVKIKPTGGKLLDVGCAHGWFVEAAMKDFEVLGVEPDKAVYDVPAAKGLPVRQGFFPEVLLSSEKFDVIVFNDVIEHIPSVELVLQSCRARLNEGGVLVLNLPSSNGIFYRLSKVFACIGKSGFFERLWQKGLPSPHVHYFNKGNLLSLLTHNGFDAVKSGNLPTLGLTGLYTRISYTGELGLISRSLVYCAVAAALPFLRLLPSDIIYVISKRR